MIEFILSNLEVLFLVLSGAVGMYIRIQLKLGKIAADLETALKQIEGLQTKDKAQEEAINQLLTAFASFDGILQAEINKLIIEFTRANDK